jgi:ATP-independent RNA helicase DbpA
MPTSLSLRPELLSALTQLGWTELTPIQAAALPLVLDGRDVLGQAETGSGKTGAFGLGLLQRVRADGGVQALVLCPTRELADQVADVLRQLAQDLDNVRVLTLCGGRPQRVQRDGLQRGAHVVVGTPGRVLDHLERGSLDPSRLRCVVLDEADHMLDMGFVDQVEHVVSRCPPDRQTLLFSATFPDRVQQLSASVQTDPERVSLGGRVEGLRQQVVVCQDMDRNAAVVRLLAQHQPDAALVFCETRRDCDKLATFLTQRGAPTLALHGALEQRDRDDVLLQFANGSARVLVATNVAARGLDIAELPLVIQAELSPDPTSYVHRIGRTGRAGRGGLAVSVVAGRREVERLERIEEHLGHRIERVQVGESSSITALQPAYCTLMILSGRRDKLRKGDVLGALIKDAGLPADAIGRIDLNAHRCAVAVRVEHGDAALRFLQSARVKKRRVRAIRLGR